jgi:hypothetical protein
VLFTKKLVLLISHGQSWLASDPRFLREATRHCVVQRRWPVEIQSGEAERGSGIGLKLLSIIPESRLRFSGIPISVQNSAKQGDTKMSETSTLLGKDRTILRRFAGMGYSFEGPCYR